MLNTNFLDYQIFCWLYLHCHLIYLPFKPPTGNGLKFIINLEQVRVTRSKKTYTYANRNCCHEQWTYAGLFRIHHIFSGILLIKYVHQQIQCHLYPMFLNFMLHSRLKIRFVRPASPYVSCYAYPAQQDNPRTVCPQKAMSIVRTIVSNAQTPERLPWSFT